MTTRTAADVLAIIDSVLVPNLAKMHAAFADTVNQTGLWDGKPAEWTHTPAITGARTHFYEMIMPMTYGILTVYLRDGMVMVMYSLSAFGTYNQPLYRNRLERSFSHNDTFSEKKIINTFSKKVEGLIQAVATWATDANALLKPTSATGDYTVSDNNILKQIEQLRLHLQYRVQAANLHSLAIHPVFPALMDELGSFERSIIDTRADRAKQPNLAGYWNTILFL